MIVGHVTKDGSIAGPRVLEHLVDVVLHFEGERNSRLRMVRAVKNRFGPVDEVGCFDLSAEGIVAITDPTGLFLDAPPRARARHLRGGGPGGPPAAAGRGAGAGDARAGRAAAPYDVRGWTASRVAMILAVLQQHARIRLHAHDVFVSTVGGARLVRAAPATSRSRSRSPRPGRSADRPAATWSRSARSGCPASCAGCRDLPQRLAEAARLGFRGAIVPAESHRDAGAVRIVDGMSVVGVARHRRRAAAARPGGAVRATAPPRCRVHRAGEPGRSDARRSVVSVGLACPALTCDSPVPSRSSRQPTGSGQRWRRPTARTTSLRLRATLASIAPGTALRDGLERILRGRTGALIVLGTTGPSSRSRTGGFTLDVPFTATGLRELAKMDGAIVARPRRHPDPTGPPCT